MEIQGRLPWLLWRQGAIIFETFATNNIAITDREILEMAEARVLAHNFQGKEWLGAALKVSQRIYGKDAPERIKVYMREIWKKEMCK